jgi:hypothetical protein
MSVSSSLESLFAEIQYLKEEHRQIRNDVIKERKARSIIKQQTASALLEIENTKKYLEYLVTYVKTYN